MIRRLGGPITLAVMTAVFVVMFLMLSGAAPLIQLGAPAVLAALAGLGSHLLLGRTPAQITDDQYDDDARGKVSACLDLVRKIERAAKDVASPSMRSTIDKGRTVVPELLRRLEAKSPTSLYSSASQLEGHLSSLLGVVQTYADIEKHPSFYVEPDRMLVAGEEATRRFLEAQLDNIKLINQGDMASYNANLATVAPPKMPTLGTKESP